MCKTLMSISIFYVTTGEPIHMTQEQFEREMNYRVAVSIAENLLIQGLITDREYHEIDTIMIAKYRPIFGGLCR